MWNQFKHLTLTIVVSTIVGMGLFQTALNEDEPWKRHAIDSSLEGADGVRLADFNQDGLADIVTGWEESGVVKLYLNPGPAKSKQLWPQAIIGEGKSPEDAVAFDVDDDGRLEVVSCHEGKLKQVLVHQFLGIQRDTESLLTRSNWKTTPVSQLDGQMWMFATPIKLRNGQRGLVLGSKGRTASLTLLLQPVPTETDIRNWVSCKLRDCGWLMSIQNIDMDDDGDVDIVFSDRKSQSRAVAWLEQPDKKATEAKWVEHLVGATDTEPLFIDATPTQILVSTRDSKWIDFRRDDQGRWDKTEHDNPIDVPLGKAIRLLGKNTIILSANTKADNSKTQQPGLWLKKSQEPWQAIGSTRECKFDRMELIDLDGDGDLDVLTCEERQQLGVVWYENPGIH